MSIAKKSGNIFKVCVNPELSEGAKEVIKANVSPSMVSNEDGGISDTSQYDVESIMGIFQELIDSDELVANRIEPDDIRILKYIERNDKAEFIEF